MTGRKHLPANQFAASVAIKDVKMTLPLPHLHTNDVTLTLNIPNALSSAAIDVEADSFRSQVVELYNLPALGMDVGRRGENRQYFAGSKVTDAMIVIYPRIEEGGKVDITDQIVCHGDFIYNFAEGSDRALFQIQLEDETLSGEPKEALYNFNGGQFVVKHVAKIKAVPFKDLEATQKKFEALGIELLMPDEDMEIDHHPDDLMLVAYEEKAKEAIQALNLVFGRYAQDLYREAAENIRDFFVKHPKAMRNLATGELEGGYGEEVKLAIIKQAKLYAYTKNMALLPETLVEALDVTYDESEAMEAGYQAITLFGDAILGARAPYNGTKQEAMALMNLLDAATFRTNFTGEFMENFEPLINRLEAQLVRRLDSMPEAKEFYEKYLRQGIEDNIAMLSFGRFGMQGGSDMLEMMFGERGLEEAELTQRQLDERLEEHPELKEIIDRIEKEVGLENVRIEGRMVRKVEDSE